MHYIRSFRRSFLKLLGEKALLQRQNPDYFQQLMTRVDLETMISTSGMRYPAIELGTANGYVAPERYTSTVRHGSASFMGVPDVQKISEHYRQGATVSLPAIHRTRAPLRVLCENLQAQLDFPVHANVYITPGNAAGIAPHYDTHEVFALQIAGKKHWSLYEPPIELPGRMQIYVCAFLTCIESPQLRRALPPGFASHGEFDAFSKRAAQPAHTSRTLSSRCFGNRLSVPTAGPGTI